MHIRETIDTVHDFTTGKTASMLKHKPVGPVMGKIAIELFDEDGNLEQKADINNIAMDCINLAAYRVAYNRHLITTYNSSDNYTQATFPRYINQIYLTDWDKAEFKNTPFVCGKTVGKTRINDTSNSSSKILGVYNEAESSFKVNEKGQLVMKHVFDWPTHAGNGTFRSVWLAQNSESDKVLSTECFNIKSLKGLQGTNWPENLKKYFINFRSAASITFNDGTFVAFIRPQSSSEPTYKDYTDYYLIIEFEGNLMQFKRLVKIPSRTMSEAIKSNNRAIVWKSGEKYHLIGDYYPGDRQYAAKHLIIDFSGNITYNEQLFKDPIQDDNGAQLKAYGLTDTNNLFYSCMANVRDNILITMMYSYVDGKYYNYAVYYDCEKHTITKTPLNDLFNKDVIPELADNYKIYPDRIQGKILQLYADFIPSNYGDSYKTVFMNVKNGIPSVKEICSNKVFKSVDSYYRNYFINAAGGAYVYVENYDLMTYYVEPFLRAATHSLLPAPVTKKPSNTMKVTYEIIVDVLPQEKFVDFEDFLDKNL